MPIFKVFVWRKICFRDQRTELYLSKSDLVFVRFYDFSFHRRSSVHGFDNKANYEAHKLLAIIWTLYYKVYMSSVISHKVAHLDDFFVKIRNL